MRRTLAMLFAVAALGLAACGDDSEETTSETENTEETTELTAQPEPAEPVSVAMEEINAAFADQDCDLYFERAHPLTRAVAETDAPATKEECQAAEPLFADFEGLEFTELDQFGTAAITEGVAPEGVAKAPDEHTALVWLLEPDGSWGHVQALFIGDEQIGTEPAGDPMPNAEAFIDAARDGDCKAMEPTINPDGALAAAAEGDLAKACELITDGEVLAPALEDTPETELVDLGGTLDNAFVGLPTSDGYFTIHLTTRAVKPGEEQQNTEMLVNDVRSNTVAPEDLAPEE